MSRSKQLAIKYVLAAASAVAALLLREMLGPAFGTHYPYHTVWLAVTFAAWYCGVGPSIVAITIGMVGIWYWFLPPYDSFSAKNHTEYFGMLSFLAFSAVIVALGESNRRTAAKRKKAEDELRKAHEELEDRVKQRTAELERAKEAARALSARILTVQDEERRRIARGLHDSLGQYLTALKINLELLAASRGNKEALAVECSNIVERCIMETRTISYLLHPPLLDETGFGSAARWYVDGFARRSGIRVNFALPELPRLHREIELALFRALQEALTNVHRHSECSAVDVAVVLDAMQVRLTVKDNGKGIPRERLDGLLQSGGQAGVGLAGMRERVRDLGGSLQIQSDGSGTAVVVEIPLREEPASAYPLEEESHGGADYRDASTAPPGPPVLTTPLSTTD
jgi:signal transduction histidine kinase